LGLGSQYSGEITFTTEAQLSRAIDVTDGDVYAQNVDAGGFLGLAPALLSPAHGTIFSSDTVRLSWTRVLPTSTKYWLDVATDSLFTFRSSDSTITDTSHVAGNLAHPQSYWWRARGYDNGCPFSAARDSHQVASVEEDRGC
jgi:hypothetical protein